MASGMNSRKTLSYAVILILSSLAMLCSCGGRDVKSVPKTPVEQLPAPLPQEQVILSPNKIKDYGLVITQAAEKTLFKTLSLPVIVERDETRIEEVQALFPGKIEEVYVEGPGSVIQKGQPLFKMSSPVAVSAQENYLEALRKAANSAEDQDANASQAKALRERLLDWGFTPADLDHIAATNAPYTAFTFFSLIDGILKTHQGVVGMNVEPNSTLFTIADLSHAVAEAKIGEDYLPYLHIGQPVQLRSRQFPSIAFGGQVVQFSNNTRSQAVDVQMTFSRITQTPKLDKKGTVTLLINFGTYLSVPKEAIVGSHQRKIVYVPLTGGRFESREIQTGLVGDNDVQVTRGLNEGDFIVLNPKPLLKK